MIDNKYARELHVFIYGIVALINCILGHFSRPGEDLFFIMVLVGYYVLTTILLSYVGSKPRVRQAQHMMLSGVLLLICAYGAGMNTGDRAIYYLMSFVPLISLMTYMETKMYKVFLILYYFQLTVVSLADFGFVHNTCSRVQRVSAVLVSILFSLLMYYFQKMQDFRRKYIAEQNQSLSDMQKIVLAKCVEAKAATKSKSDFLSNMSHEIRTPLNAILGMNEMIIRENRDDTIAKYAGNVDRSGQMLLALINDVLDFSKIESGKLELLNSEYQLFAVLKDILVMLDSRIKKKELSLYTEVSDDIPKIMVGDDVRIKQIITNIMTNAIKYTKEGSITLKASVERGSNPNKCLVKISVKDTGQGMSEENVSRLFDSFSRFNQKENRQIEGTGLGMAITKSLIDAMHGSIEVYSKLGEGSEFIVSIPQKVSDNTPAGDFKAFSSKEIMDKKREESLFVRPDAKALIVDDSRVNLAVAKGLLKYSKMQVSTASSGQECIDKIKDNDFDIILLDHMMPQMDGIETLKRIRSEHLCDDIPIIALTANAVGNARDFYISQGFNDYLSKPISGERIEEIMKKWLKSADGGR